MSSGENGDGSASSGVSSANFKDVNPVTSSREPKNMEYPSIRPGTAGVREAIFSDIQTRLAQQLHDDADRPPTPEELKLREERRRLDEQNQLKNEAFEMGRQEANQDGAQARADLQTSHEQQIKELAETLHSLADKVRDLECQADKDALHLAIQIAEKVIRRKITADREALVSTVMEVLSTADGGAPVHITCDPTTAEQIRRSLSHSMRSMGIEDWVVQEDPELDAGDLLLSQGPMTLDARIETRLQRIERSLLRELKLETAEEQDK